MQAINTLRDTKSSTLYLVLAIPLSRVELYTSPIKFSDHIGSQILVAQSYCVSFPCHVLNIYSLLASLYPIAAVKERAKWMTKKSAFLKKGISIFAVLSVTCGFLFLRFQTSLPIQIILNMLFKPVVPVCTEIPGSTYSQLILDQYRSFQKQCVCVF